MLKSVDTLADCDPRFRDMVIVPASGHKRPLQMSDLHSLVAPISLSADVPDEIRHEFDTARNAFVYSWYVYEFATLAEIRCFAALELALRRRLDPSSANTTKSPGLSRLLKTATESGLLRREDFQMPSPAGSGEMACSLDLLPMLRNHIAHGNIQLLPQATPNNMQLCAEVIEAIYKPSFSA
jgi:hypothetical protein